MNLRFWLQEDKRSEGLLLKARWLLVLLTFFSGIFSAKFTFLRGLFCWYSHFLGHGYREVLIFWICIGPL